MICTVQFKFDDCADVPGVPYILHPGTCSPNDYFSFGCVHVFVEPTTQLCDLTYVFLIDLIKLYSFVLVFLQPLVLSSL